MGETHSPDTSVGDSAKNPQGQRDTMAGSCGDFKPPFSELSDSKSIHVDPTSYTGAKGKTSL